MLKPKTQIFLAGATAQCLFDGAATGLPWGTRAVVVVGHLARGTPVLLL